MGRELQPCAWGTAGTLYAIQSMERGKKKDYSYTRGQEGNGGIWFLTACTQEPSSRSRQRRWGRDSPEAHGRVDWEATSEEGRAGGGGLTGYDPAGRQAQGTEEGDPLSSPPPPPYHHHHQASGGGREMQMLQAGSSPLFPISTAVGVLKRLHSSTLIRKPREREREKGVLPLFVLVLAAIHISLPPDVWWQLMIFCFFCFFICFPFCLILFNSLSLLYKYIERFLQARLVFKIIFEFTY